MNATPPVSHTPLPSDPAQFGSAASANSVNSVGNGDDFASTLIRTSSKPARKPAGAKAVGGSSTGGPLPIPGNPSPPQAASAAAAGVALGNGPSATAPTTGAGSSSVLTVAAAPGTPTGSGDSPQIESGTSGGAASGVPAASTGAQGAAAPAPGTGGESVANGAQPALGTDAPPSAAQLRLIGGAAATAVPGAQVADAGAGLGTADVRGIKTGQDSSTAQNISASGAATSAAPGAARAGDRVAVKPAAGTAATAATNAATSGSSSGAGSARAATGSGASSSTDAGVQAAADAAMSAAATGAAAIASGFANSSDAPSASTDELATPAIGNVGQVVAGANGTPVAALTAAAAAAASAAAVQAAKGFADAGASDKRGTDAGGNGGGGASTKSAAAATTGATVGADGTQAGAAAQLNLNIPSATDAAPAANLKVSAGIDTPEFGQGFADRVSYMVDNNLSSAKLQVNPPQLGPIEVRIAVQGGHAQVWLTSHSAVTRDALESSSPKLREMLGAQGFGQVSVDISQRSFQERPNTPPAYDWASASPRGGSSASSSVSTAAAPVSRISNSAVDAYA